MANEKNLTPWQPGQSGNPQGKPKGTEHSKTRLNRLMKLMKDIENPITGKVEGFSVAEQMDLQQILKALDGDTKAYITIMDRLEGKATVNLSSPDGSMTPNVLIEGIYAGKPNFRADNEYAEVS